MDPNPQSGYIFRTYYGSIGYIGLSYDQMLWSTEENKYTNFIQEIQACLYPKVKPHTPETGIGSEKIKNEENKVPEEKTEPVIILTNESKKTAIGTSDVGKSTLRSEKRNIPSKDKKMKKTFKESTTAAVKLVRGRSTGRGKPKANLKLDMAALYNQLVDREKVKVVKKQTKKEGKAVPLHVIDVGGDKKIICNDCEKKGRQLKIQ